MLFGLIKCYFLFMSSGQLREDLQFDASALMEIMLALYHAQEAVSCLGICVVP